MCPADPASQTPTTIATAIGTVAVTYRARRRDHAITKPRGYGRRRLGKSAPRTLAAAPSRLRDQQGGGGEEKDRARPGENSISLAVATVFGMSRACHRPARSTTSFMAVNDASWSCRNGATFKRKHIHPFATWSGRSLHALEKLMRCWAGTLQCGSRSQYLEGRVVGAHQGACPEFVYLEAPSAARTPTSATTSCRTLGFEDTRPTAQLIRSTDGIDSSSRASRMDPQYRYAKTYIDQSGAPRPSGRRTESRR